MTSTGTNNLVFVHIPKTAGTSLRKSLCRALRGRLHLFDYGPDQKLTSDAVRYYRYPDSICQKDQSLTLNGLIGRLRRNGHRQVSIRDYVDDGKKIFLMGHFEASPYLELFPPSSFVTFLRNPVDRVVSEYKHFVRNFGFEGSLLDFCSAPYQRNKQTRYLAGLDIKTMGFVGRVENFELDLRRLEELLGSSLAVKRDNVAPSSQSVELDQTTLEHIKNLNAEDLRLYDEVCNMHSEDMRTIEVKGRERIASLENLATKSAY